MKKYNKSSQKGMISAFVMMAMFFFLFVMLGIFSITSKRAQTQTESYELAQDKYYTENMSDVYNSRIADADAIIPIYTKEQLWSIGENVAIEIDGKIYDFSVADLSKYELQNDIVINIDTDDLKDVKITESNGHKVYYYKDELYYQKTTSQGSLTVNGYQFEQVIVKNNLGYATEGLMLHYDGIQNTENLHDSNSTVWKDLSGNGNDGTLHGGIWADNYVKFDGIDDWLGIRQMNYENITLEAVVEYNQISSSEMVLLCNFEHYGYGLATWITGENGVSKFTKHSMGVYTSGAWHFVNPPENYTTNRMYSLSGSYNGVVINLFENGNKYTKSISGTITKPTDNTIMMVGANPKGDSPVGSYFNGKVYSVRVYNRALTDKEVKQNYEIDKARFNIN